MRACKVGVSYIQSEESSKNEGEEEINLNFTFNKDN